MPSPSAAASGSGQQPRAAPAFQMVFPPDRDYSPDLQCRVSDRSHPTFKPMPEFTLIKENFVKGSALPTTNLENLEKPPNLSFVDEILWDLARLLEGRRGVYQSSPKDFESQGSNLTRVSKHLAYVLRHSTEVAFAKDNWMGLGTLIANNPRILNSAEVIFVAVMANPKQRYEFSRPVYVSYTTRVESRVSGLYLPAIYIRARQGHSQSTSPTAGMQKLDDSCLPLVALHGTSVKKHRQHHEIRSHTGRRNHRSIGGNRETVSASGSKFTQYKFGDSVWVPTREPDMHQC